MATTFSRSLFCDQSTDANFRAWAQFIHDTFVAGGWVQTADTGQATISSMTKPGGANAKTGYEIWRMNDALQGSAPCFVKIWYGSGVSGAGYPGIWLEVGTGSNGTGSITGMYYDNLASANTTSYASQFSATDTTHSWGSADTDRICVGMLISTAGSYGLIFGIERHTDSAGARLGTGVTIIVSRSAKAIDKGCWAGPGITQHQSQLSYMRTPLSPSAQHPEMSIAPLFTYDLQYRTQQPGFNFMVIPALDTANGAYFAVRWAGKTVYYQQLFNIIAACNVFATEGNGRVVMRYD